MINGTTASSSPSVPSDIPGLATRIIHGDRLAEPLFRLACSRGLRLVIDHHLRGNTAAEPLVEQVTDGVIAALRNGTIVGGDVTAWMCRQARHLALQLKPQQQTIAVPASRMGREVFATIPALHQRLLRRFYLDAHTKETICAEEDLSPAEFDAIRSNARKKMMPQHSSASENYVAGCA